MWGWDNADIVFASRSKRWRTSGEEERCSGNTLTATVRSSRVSRARYTSPIPPAPIGERTSYGPRRAPAEMDIATLPDSTLVASLQGAVFVPGGITGGPFWT